MTDRELADTLRSTTETLTALLAQAKERGIRVEMAFAAAGDSQVFRCSERLSVEVRDIYKVQTVAL